ncbi:MAG: head maturation protease, ClpP-related [Armatimonadota bacterium]
MLGLVLLIALTIGPAEANTNTESEQPAADAGKFWRMVRNETTSGEPTSADIYIYGAVMGDWWNAWMPDDTYPKQFADDLKALGAVDEIHLRINSPGGDVFAAQTIYNLLSTHSAKVTSHIDGLAASAASIIALAGDEVIMPGNAMMMIHNPAFTTSGDARQLRADAALLDQVRETILAVYQGKTGMDRSALIGLMNSETWMTAEEAKSYGFVDTVTAPIRVAATARMGRFIVNETEIDFRGVKEWPEAMLATATSEVPEPELDDPAVETPEPEPAAPTVEPEPTPAEPEPAAAEPDADPVAIERKRITDIMDLAIPGAEQIITDGITSGASAGDVAQAIIKSDSVRNAAALNARRLDGQGLGVGSDGGGDDTPKVTAVGLLTNAYNKLRGLK